MELTATKVHDIFLDCLFKEDEDKTDYIPCKGITINVGLHPQRVESHKDEIYTLLQELPENFQKEHGGGWSFLEASVDKNGNQWGEHKNIEELMLLGMAIQKVEYLLPRELWMILPGGLPYIVVL